jgi:hypothetical protein
VAKNKAQTGLVFKQDADTPLYILLVIRMMFVLVSNEHFSQKCFVTTVPLQFCDIVLEKHSEIPLYALRDVCG